MDGSWVRMSDQELTTVLAQLERERNIAFGKQLAIIAEMTSRGTTDHRGLGCDPGVWVRQVLRMDCHPARDLVRHAQALHPSHTPSGADIPAAMPVTAAAVQTGALSPAHVRAIHTIMTKIPLDARDEDRANAETLLTEAAEVIEPGQVTHLGRHILARLDHDGPEPKDIDTQPRRYLRIRHRGRYTAVHGELDAEAATLLDTVLQPLAKRRSVEANGGLPDTRDPDERHADALVEALQLATTSPDMPTEARRTSHPHRHRTPGRVRAAQPPGHADHRHERRTATTESLRRRRHPRRTRRPLRDLGHRR